MSDALVALREQRPDLARALADVEADGIDTVVGPRGARTCQERGVLLGSSYDPVAEGQRLAHEMDREPVDLLVAIGAGLGHHLEAYRGRSGARVLVYEPSRARLRAVFEARQSARFLTLERVEWTWTLEQFEHAFRRLYTPGTRLGAFVHPALRSLDPDAARAALERVARSKDAGDLTAGTLVRMAADWGAITAFNAPGIARSVDFGCLSGLLDGRAAVVCAAGPSLARQLPALLRFRDRVAVVAIGQALPALRRVGIEPDLVHIVESQNVTHQLTQYGDSSDAILAVCPSAHPTLFEVPVRARLVDHPVTNAVGLWLGEALGRERTVGGGASVAQSAVRLAAAMGANPVILIGQDLAFTGGRVYAPGSAYELQELRTREDGELMFTNLDRKGELFGVKAAAEKAVGVVYVEGWDGEPIATSKSYATFLVQYEGIARELARGGTELVNATEGGARIPGLHHECFADVLDAVAAEPRNVRDEILQRCEAEGGRDPAELLPAVASAERSLRRVERAARAGALRCERAASADGPPTLCELRSIARLERRVLGALQEVYWFDAVVAGDVYCAGVARVMDASDASELDRALAHSRELFETAARGLRPARRLLALLRERVEAYGGEDG